MGKHQKSETASLKAKDCNRLFERSEFHIKEIFVVLCIESKAGYN